jgi:hypothetical protein
MEIGRRNAGLSLFPNSSSVHIKREEVGPQRAAVTPITDGVSTTGSGKPN